MASDVQICNMAISHLGSGKSISTLENDKSSEGLACNQFFSTARETTLADFAWPFATKFAVLGLIEAEPTDEWAYSYQYPTDCIRLRRILSGVRVDDRDSRVPYKIIHGTSAKEIYTDMEDAEIEYTFKVTNSERFSSDFVQALAWQVAHLIAPRLSRGDPYKSGEKALQMYYLKISTAKANAKNEEQPDKEQDSEFIQVRDT